MATSIPPVTPVPVASPAFVPPHSSAGEAFELLFAAASQAQASSRENTTHERIGDDTDSDRCQADLFESDRDAKDPDRSDSTDRKDDRARDAQRDAPDVRRRDEAHDEPGTLPPWAQQNLAAPWAVLPVVQANPLSDPQGAKAAWSQLNACVERLLVQAGPHGADGGPAAMFTLAGDLLTDTAVSLTRTGNGWLLRLQTQDPLLLDDAKRHELALRKRFAERGLGELVVEHV